MNKLTKVLKPGGHLSHILNNDADKADIQALQRESEAESDGISASMTLVKPNGAQLREVFELVAAGKVKLEVAKVGAMFGRSVRVCMW